MILKAGVDASVQFKRKSQEQSDKRNKRKVFCLLHAFVTVFFEFKQRGANTNTSESIPSFLTLLSIHECKSNRSMRLLYWAMFALLVASRFKSISNSSKTKLNTFQRVNLFFLFALSHHSFNLPHDGDNNPCTRSRGDQHLMARSLSFDNKPWSWSNCSRDKLTNFLE